MGEGLSLAQRGKLVVGKCRTHCRVAHSDKQRDNASAQSGGKL